MDWTAYAGLSTRRSVILEAGKKLIDGEDARFFEPIQAKGIRISAGWLLKRLRNLADENERLHDFR